MVSGTFQSVAILGAVIAFYITDLVFISCYDKQRQTRDSGKSWSYTCMVLAAVAFLTAQPIFLPGLGLHTDAWWGALVQATGFLFLLSGLGLHGWSRAHLRQFYAERVEIQPRHCLIDTGPYIYVRHPMFTSYFMLIIGLSLVNPAVPTLLMAVYTFWDFGQAAKQEEILLGENLPGYTDYMARTSRFFPRLRKHSGGKK